ncbi:GMC oxidoreductase-domain-containing protein [Xylariaceae sp. FL0662B]|nr:GMC oxidoreductase-domain-containing protein [Xylariaceae sp. FL0662B]
MYTLITCVSISTGTVNWSVRLQTQDFVRREWASKGLSFFDTPSYQKSLDRVCEFMGVNTTQIRHNHGNTVLLEGAKKLGWKAQLCPQNTRGAEHCCGHCGYGCRSAEKQGPAASWLPAAGKAGARFIEGLDVSEILFDDRVAKQATGVIGTWTARDADGNVHTPREQRQQRRIYVEAKEVIVACGTLNTPLLLQRSNFRNPHIGRNLHLHPSGILVAAFDNDVRGWEGGIITSLISEFENLDGKGHGVKIEASGMLPHMTVLTLPWRGALQYKIDALKYRQMNSFGAIVRDRDTGSVSPDPDDGRPVIRYTPSAFDRRHIVLGLVAIAKLCYLQGAVEIFPYVTNLPSFECHKPVVDRTLGDPEFLHWLQRLNSHDMAPSGNFFGCAHQMGSCRMSRSSSDGVVDDHGKVWDAQNIYVADASVFPSASGVNPMITTMAIADHVTRWFLSTWRLRHGPD